VVIEGLGTRLRALLLKQEPMWLLYIGDCSTYSFRYYFSLVDVIRSSADAPEVAENVAKEFKIKAKVRVSSQAVLGE
jgi:hypothetical protein